MAFSELIKNFENIREYMREFYVYGFKTRDDFVVDEFGRKKPDSKGLRTYDNARSRVDSWLKDYMFFKQDINGKRYFISVDSRSVARNPLFKAFRSKSFTDRDVVFHFLLLNLLSDGQPHCATDIIKIVDFYDSSSVTKKLNEYRQLGLITAEKQGNRTMYSLTSSDISLGLWEDAVAFFSESEPLGVIGSTLLDKLDSTADRFRFKHHYILHALDSEVLYGILEAMNHKRYIKISSVGKKRSELKFPVKIFVSTQTGRHYVLLCQKYYDGCKFSFARLDRISSVNIEHGIDADADAEFFHNAYKEFSENLWGVSLSHGFTDKIEMDIRAEPGEEYIIRRLEREKRCGKVEKLDDNTYRYSAEVYDAAEMIPWIRSYICRIVRLECTDEYVTETFYKDLEAMYEKYGIKGDE